MFNATDIKKYFWSRNIKSIVHYNDDNKTENYDGPAIRFFWPNGHLKTIIWSTNGEFDEGKTFYKSGKLESEETPTKQFGYYETGELKYTQTPDNIKYFALAGHIISIIHYKDGKQYKRTFYAKPNTNQYYTAFDIPK